MGPGKVPPCRAMASRSGKWPGLRSEYAATISASSLESNDDMERVVGGSDPSESKGVITVSGELFAWFIALLKIFVSHVYNTEDGC